MYRSTTTMVNQFNFASQKFLANASIAGAQTEVGVVTKPLNGYVILMLELVDFAINESYSAQSVDDALDYSIQNS